MSIIIRTALEKDAIQIFHIEKMLQGSHAWSQVQILSCFTDSHVVMVAEEDANIVGYVFVQHVLDEAELHIIGVDVSFQRQGIANKLLNFVYHELKQKNVERLFLEVRVSNHAAISLYKQHGFKDVGRRKNYYADKQEGKTQYEDALVMSLTL